MGFVIEFVVDVIVDACTFSRNLSPIVICCFPFTRAVFLHCDEPRCFSAEVLPWPAEGYLIVRLHWLYIVGIREVQITLESSSDVGVVI